MSTQDEINRLDLNDPPPKVGVPNWSKLFQEWWWRKCKRHGVDPFDEFMKVLKSYENETD